MAVDMLQAKPFLTIGRYSKRIAEAVSAALPERLGMFYCPFLGDGSVFFHLANHGRIEEGCAVLTDSDKNLVKTYQGVRYNPEGTIAILRSLGVSFRPEDWREAERVFRRLPNGPLEGAMAAARVIFLDRVAAYSDPLMTFTDRSLVKPANLRRASLVLEHYAMALESKDYRETFKKLLVPREGDSVCFCPPAEWDFKRHQALHDLCVDLTSKGVAWVVVTTPSFGRFDNGKRIGGGYTLWKNEHCRCLPPVDEVDSDRTGCGVAKTVDLTESEG